MHMHSELRIYMIIGLLIHDFLAIEKWIWHACINENGSITTMNGMS